MPHPRDLRGRQIVRSLGTYLLMAMGVAASCFLAASPASSGGIYIRPPSVEFNEGRTRAVEPGSRVTVTFTADQYAFGSNGIPNIVFAVVRAGESTSHVDRSQMRI